MEEPRHIRPTWVRWQLVLLLMGFTGLNHFHRQSLPSVIDDVMRDCRFTPTDMGWINFAFLLGYVVFMVPGGWLADRRGAWFALVLSGFGTAAMVVATGSLALGTTSAIFLSFLCIRGVMGVFTTPLFPAAGRIVNAWIGFEYRAWANGLVIGATTVGVSAAPILFGALSDRLGWRGASVVMGTVTALLTAVWYLYGRNSPAEHPLVNEAERDLAPSQESVHHAEPGPELLNLLARPALLLLTLNYAVVGYYEYTLFYWMKYYFVNVRHYGEQASRDYTSTVSAAMIVAMPLGGILSDWLVRVWGYRAGRAVVPVVGMLASAVLLFSATQAVDRTAVVVLFFCSHAAIGLCEAPTWVAALEVGGRNCGTSAAIVNAGGNFGGMFGQLITAYIAVTWGWNAGFVVASGACLIGVLLWIGIRLNPPSSSVFLSTE